MDTTRVGYELRKEQHAHSDIYGTKVAVLPEQVGHTSVWNERSTLGRYQYSAKYAHHVCPASRIILAEFVHLSSGESTTKYLIVVASPSTIIRLVMRVEVSSTKHLF